MVKVSRITGYYSGRQFTMDLSCFVSCKWGTLNAFVLESLLKDICILNSLARWDSYLPEQKVSCSQDNTSLLLSGGFTAPYKRFEFSKPGVPLLQHNSSCAWVTWPCLHHPVGTELGKQRKYWPADCYYCSVRNKKVLYLLPQSLSSCSSHS